MITQFIKFLDYFIGAALGAAWSVADTSSAGAPTKVMHADGYKLAHAADVEVENLCLYWGDICSIDITKVRRIVMRVKQLQATKAAATTIAFGLASARADDPDAIATNAMFRLNLGTADNSIFCETDDGTTDTDDKATGKTLSNALKTFEINFSNGLSDVRFLIDGQRVCESTTFSIAAATGGVQPFLQIQKTSNANTDGVQIRSCYIESRE